MAGLTTHVLDTSRGKPAAGVVIHLYRWHSGERVHVKTVHTNADGRTDQPLLNDGELRVGMYELVFGAAEYFRSRGTILGSPPFLDEVVVRFGVSDPSEHHHVPLLLAPYGYSTYRGS